MKKGLISILGLIKMLHSKHKLRDKREKKKKLQFFTQFTKRKKFFLILIPFIADNNYFGSGKPFKKGQIRSWIVIIDPNDKLMKLLKVC